MNYTKKSHLMQLVDPVSRNMGPYPAFVTTAPVFPPHPPHCYSHPCSAHPTHPDKQTTLKQSSSLLYPQRFLFPWILKQVPLYMMLPLKLLNRTGNLIGQEPSHSVPSLTSLLGITCFINYLWCDGKLFPQRIQSSSCLLY